MSMITHGESSLAVDCPECEFSVLIVHDHDFDHNFKCVAPSEDIEQTIGRSR